MVKNDNAAFIFIGNVTKFVNAITSIRANQIYVHASEARSETVDHDELGAMFLDIRKKLGDVVKTPAVNKTNITLV